MKYLSPLLLIILFSCGDKNLQNEIQLAEHALDSTTALVDSMRLDTAQQRQLITELRAEIHRLEKHQLIEDSIRQTEWLKKRRQEGEHYFQRNGTFDQYVIVNGDFHEDEVVEGAEKMEWIGLFHDEEKGSYLKKVKLNIGKFDDVITGGDGKVIEFEGEQQPIAAFSNIKELLEGDLDFPIAVNEAMWPGKTVRGHSNQRTYTFFAKGKLNEEGLVAGYNGVTDYSVHFSESYYSQEQRQTKSTIHYVSGTFAYESKPFTILWAGDLDRDGKPDLLLEDSWHYNTHTSVSLYLSSRAKKGKPFELVAHIVGVGC